MDKVLQQKLWDVWMRKKGGISEVRRCLASNGVLVDVNVGDPKYVSNISFRSQILTLGMALFGFLLSCH